MGCTPTKESTSSWGEKDQSSHTTKTANWRLPSSTKMIVVVDGKWWLEAIKLRVEKGQQRMLEVMKKRRGWKTIRLFVSSTFSDMHAEREHLVKRVFPKLREWCEPRKLRLVECDLRWGIPKDSTTKATIQTCLSEIDRCKEENQYPYFINLLSERYGWVPTTKEVPDDIRMRYQWVPGMSITAMEVHHAAYREANPNALFFFRNPSFTEELPSKEIENLFVEQKEESKTSLLELKHMIKDAFPEKSREYSCKVDGVNEDGKVKMKGLEEFGDQVLDQFLDLLAYQYPTDKLHDAEDIAQVQREEHEIFMANRSQVLLGRDNEVQAITDYINSSSNVPLVVVGKPGAGKSALIAYMAEKYVQNTKRYKVFYHFVGATPGSTNLHRLLSRIWTELMHHSDPVPVDLDELIRSMANVYSKANKWAARAKKEIILFVDALNQMESDGESFKLRWIPSTLPPNVHVVVSTLEGPFLNTLRSRDRKPREVAVDPLPKGVRGKIVEKILSEYNKRLDKEQMSKLVRKSESGNPLWLSTACEELRLYGNFDKLTSKIESLAGDLSGLLQQMLERVANDNGGDLVKATVCLLECSKHGLLETELLELLAIKPMVPSVDGEYENANIVVGEKVPMAEWALVYLGLKRFLRPCGSSGEGRLDFYHRSISKAVRNVYIDKGNQKKWWHRRLADYFQQSSDIERRAVEFPFHLETIDDMNRLEHCLLEWPMFETMYKEETKIELMRYWRLVGGYDVAAKMYGDALTAEMNQFYGESAIDRKAQEREYVRKTKLVSSFLTDIGQYDLARQKLGQVIQWHLMEYREDDTESLYTLLKLCYNEGLQG
ncbi:TPR repeat-containing protein DDB_G0287407-like [Glandiceps talaboti]